MGSIRHTTASSFCGVWLKIRNCKLIGIERDYEHSGTHVVAPFDDPIPLPDGRRLRTLYDAGHYVAAPSKAVQQWVEWRPQPRCALARP